jgi:hypothetical protein
MGREKPRIGRMVGRESLGTGAPSDWHFYVGGAAAHTSAMGVRTRGLDIAIGAKRQVADAAARAETKAVIERWNEQLAASRDILWSPTIRAALIAGTLGLTCSARAAARAGQSICGRWTVTRSRQSPPWCWGCGARGARNRRQCRGSSDCTHCRLRQRSRRRTCEPRRTMTPRRFPAPWRADKMPGGYVVRDANGQALAYIYSRDSEAEAMQAKVLTKDEARRIAVNIARLPDLVRKADRET